MFTGYKLVRQFLLPAETVHYIWLLQEGGRIRWTDLAGHHYHEKQSKLETRNYGQSLAEAKYDD